MIPDTTYAVVLHQIIFKNKVVMKQIIISMTDLFFRVTSVTSREM